MTALKVILLMALLAGCARQELGLVEKGPKPDRYVREVLLSDGTRCAVYSGYKAGGISCDWK